VDNWEIENPDDLASVPANKMKKILALKTFDVIKNVVIDIDPTRASVSIDDATNKAAIAEYHRICDILDDCRVLPWRLIGALSVVALLAFEYFSPTNSSLNILFIPGAFLVLSLNLYVLMEDRYIAFREPNSQTFLQRKKDDLLLLLIGAIVGTALTQLTTYASQHWWPNAP